MSLGQEILVGLSLSLTGKYSRQGKQALDGIRLWESYVNQHGGSEAGSPAPGPVRLLYYDDRSRVAIARQNTLRLLTEDRVDILVGPYSSALTMAVAEVAEQHQRLLWNHGGSSDEIFNRGYHCLVGIATPASDYLRGLPRWLEQKRRVAILHSPKGTFATQVVRGLLEALPQGTAVRSRPISLAAVREIWSFDPEALVLAGSFQEEVTLVKARQLWPQSIRHVAAVAAGIHAFHEELCEKAEGIIGPSQWEAEVSFPQIQGPDSHWFVEQFQECFGCRPDYIAAGSFAAGLILAECIRQAGSLEDQRLREVAAGLDLHTFYGRFRVNPATGRQVGHRILLIRWQQGRKVVLEEH